VDAQYNLGSCFYQGNRDFVEAVGWFLSAAEQGHERAQRSVASTLVSNVATGEGVVLDPEEPSAVVP
jgi:TPR repeat protein